MRVGIVFLSLLLSPAAGIACEWPVVAVGSGIVNAVSRQDRRELEQLLGTQLDHVVCGRIQRIRKYTSGFTVKRGFLVLTKDEALFVQDGKTKEILFRTGFAFVRHAMRSGFGDMQSLTVAIDDAEFRFELACDAASRDIIDEFDLRTAPRTRRTPMPYQPCTD